MTTTTARILSPLGSLATLSILERDDWNGGHIVIFDRPHWEHARQRPELDRPGVYVLVGGRTAYVGEGDPVLERLRSHNQNRDFWTRAIALTSLNGQLNKAHVQFLEARLCATMAKAYTLENKVLPAPPTLSEFDQVWATQALGVAEDALKLFGILFDTHPRQPTTPEGGAAPDPQAQLETPGDPALQVLTRILNISVFNGISVRGMFQLCEEGQREYDKYLEPWGLRHSTMHGLQVGGPAVAKRIATLFAHTPFDHGVWLAHLRRIPGVYLAQARFNRRAKQATCLPAPLVLSN